MSWSDYSYGLSPFSDSFSSIDYYDVDDEFRREFMHTFKIKQEKLGDWILENNDKYDGDKFMKIWRNKVLYTIIINFNRDYIRELKRTNRKEYRKRKITIALKKHFIEFRRSSLNIKSYINGTSTDKLKDVVYRMCCYKYWFEYCQARHGTPFINLKYRYPLPNKWPWEN